MFLVAVREYASFTAALLDSRAPAKHETRSAFVCGAHVHSHNDVNTLRNKVQAGRAIAREKTREDDAGCANPIPHAAITAI
jgi:hypothetical protein